MIWLMAAFVALVVIILMAVIAVLAFNRADRARPGSWQERFFNITILMAVLCSGPFSLLAALFTLIRLDL